MTMSQSEAVASLHVLVAVAQADKELHDEEQKAIQSALDATGLSDVIGAKEIFEDTFDLDEQVALLSTPEARDETYKSAYSLAFADGDCSEEEKALLAQLRKKLAISEARDRELDRLFKEKLAEKKSYFTFIEDPAERETKITSETRKCSIISAVLGAAPWPGLSLATDLAVVYLQVCLVRDIGAMHGREVDMKKAKSMLAAAGVGTGARLAISNLAKFLPGWGSVIGAAMSYASTYAVGKVFHKYFLEGGTLDEAALKAEFAKAQAEGKTAYEADKAEANAKEKAAKEQLSSLAEDAKAGRLSHEEIGERISKV